jgi:hypothetical protein
MRVTIHQPNYLPWRGFVEKARAADLLVLLDTVPFTRGGYTNRTRFRSTAERGWSWMTVPVKASLGQPIRTVEIDGTSWRHKHYATIHQTYKRTELWSRLGPLLQGHYAREWRTLSALNSALIFVLLGAYGVRTPILWASELKSRGTGSELLLNLCCELGADVYLSGESGPKYLDRKSFGAAGVQIQLSAWNPEVTPPVSAICDLFEEWEVPV